MGCLEGTYVTNSIAELSDMREPNLFSTKFVIMDKSEVFKKKARLPSSPPSFSDITLFFPKDEFFYLRFIIPTVRS